MTREDMLKAQAYFGVPEKFYDVAQVIVQEVEWELILRMGDRDVTDTELRTIIEKNRLAASPADFINECYRRYVLNKVPEAPELTWHIANLYCRYPYFAQFEYYAYGKLPKETKEALNAWDMEVYLGIYAKDVEAKKQGINTHVHNSDFLTLDEAIAFARKHEGHITRIPCNCKSQYYYHDRPLNVCLEFFDGPNSNADRGRGEQLTLEQAEAHLRMCNRKGLMQNGEDAAMCNCDGLCCYPLYMARTVGTRGIYPKSHYNIDWHEDECINCGRCTQICNFKAFARGDDNKVRYNPDLCWGCTICAPNCPKGAIHLIPKQQDNTPEVAGSAVKVH